VPDVVRAVESDWLKNYWKLGARIETVTFAFHHNATLLHKDPEFETLAGQVRLEALPYKKAR
jgi:hypothetical protein